MRDEEDEVLPRLQEVLTPGRLRRLGVAWEITRRVAPTRAHPVVARRPPGNVLAALPLSVVDRVRDVTDAATVRGPAVLRAPLGRAGRGLRDVSHRIEGLPWLQAGEDPSTRSGPVPAPVHAAPAHRAPTARSRAGVVAGVAGGVAGTALVVVAVRARRRRTAGARPVPGAPGAGDVG